jgi:hypothetical protein
MRNPNSQADSDFSPCKTMINKGDISQVTSPEKFDEDEKTPSPMKKPLGFNAASNRSFHESPEKSFSLHNSPTKVVGDLIHSSFVNLEEILKDSNGALIL